MNSKYNYFWGFESPFSQWHPSLIKINEKEFISAEHAMMCWKLAMFEGSIDSSWLYLLKTEADAVLLKSDIGLRLSDEELSLIRKFRDLKISAKEIVENKKLGRTWSAIQAKIKRCGRLVKNYDELRISKQRVKMLVTINEAKFLQNRDLLCAFLNSGGNFVEASKFDKIYGIGMTKEEIILKGENPKDWKGLNILGNSLNAVFERLVNVKNE